MIWKAGHRCCSALLVMLVRGCARLLAWPLRRARIGRADSVVNSARCRGFRPCLPFRYAFGL